MDSKNTLTTSGYWETRARIHSGSASINFKRLFAKYLVKDPATNRLALEIGCVPGTYLGYICKTYGYFPEGIDYVKDATSIVRDTLSQFGLNESTIYEQDFLEWVPPKRYDLVCSFGLVEHFSEPSEIVAKHVSLLKEGGTLIIEFPNFNHGQKILHYYLDKSNLDRHNTEIMTLDFFYDIQAKYNLDVLYAGYEGGLFDFWWENSNPSNFQSIVRFFLRYIAIITRNIPLRSKFLSPFIVFIARKR